MEVKLSDRIISDNSEIAGLIKFIETNPSSNNFSNSLVTTEIVSGIFSVKNFPVRFQPCSELVFNIGKALFVPLN